MRNRNGGLTVVTLVDAAWLFSDWASWINPPRPATIWASSDLIMTRRARSMIWSSSRHLWHMLEGNLYPLCHAIVCCQINLNTGSDFFVSDGKNRPQRLTYSNRTR